MRGRNKGAGNCCHTDAEVGPRLLVFDNKMPQKQQQPSLSWRRSFRRRLFGNPRETDDRGWTPLHIAARKGDLKEVKRILAGGGNVNVPVWGPKFPGVTPLHVAASGGHIKVMDELLEHGANIEARTKGGCGWTPLHNAAKERNKKAVQFLLENGAFLPPDINDGRFNPPLHYCPGLEWAYKIKEKASMSATDGYFDQETCSKG